MKTLLGYIPIILTFLGGIVAIVVAFWLSREPPIITKILLVAGLITLVGATWGQIDQSRQMEALVLQVTGGDSFVHFEAVPLDENNLRPVLKHNGKYPISPLRIEVLETGNGDGFGGHAKALHPGSWRIINFSIYGSHMRKTFHWTFEPAGDSAVYAILMESRNGSIVQIIQIRKVRDQWTTASRILTFPDMEKTLFEQVDDNYPRDEFGNVEWKKISL